MTAKAITCVICGSESAREAAERRSVHLLGHVATFARREYKCAACGESFTTDDQGEANERAERAATARALRNIEGPSELKRLRDLMHLTQSELENALGLGRNTVARWETAQRPVPGYIKTIIRLLAVNPTALALLKDQDLSDDERIGETVAEGVIQPAQPNYVAVLGTSFAAPTVAAWLSDALEPISVGAPEDINTLMHLPPIAASKRAWTGRKELAHVHAKGRN